MSSSTSSSKHRAFLIWAALGLIAANVVVAALPWMGPDEDRAIYRDCVRNIGRNIDFLIVGDSKVSAFTNECTVPGIPPYRGLAFSGDSLTPIFHLQAFKQLRQEFPYFAPKVVFLGVGANNFNLNGLHALRDHGLFTTMNLSDVWSLTIPNGYYLQFIEAVLSRSIPLYGRRVQITHFLLPGLVHHRVPAPTTEAVFAGPKDLTFPGIQRQPILDQNYLATYQRSVYSDYVVSKSMVDAVRQLVELVKSYGGVPVITLLPVEAEMNALEERMVGDRFDGAIKDLAASQNVKILDFRRRTQYEFFDINHLSTKGAHDLTVAELLPFLKNHLPAQQSSGRGLSSAQ